MIQNEQYFSGVYNKRHIFITKKCIAVLICIALSVFFVLKYIHALTNESISSKENKITEIHSINRMDNSFLSRVPISEASFNTGLAINITKKNLSTLLPSNLNPGNSTETKSSSYFSTKIANTLDIDSSKSLGKRGNLQDKFRLKSSSPQIIGIIPNYGQKDKSLTSAVIYGSKFHDGMTVKLARNGEDGIEVADVRRINERYITCKIDLTLVATGVWDVVVTNPPSQSAILSNGFTVKTKSPIDSDTDNYNETNVEDSPVSETNPEAETLEKSDTTEQVIVTNTDVDELSFTQISNTNTYSSTDQDDSDSDITETNSSEQSVTSSSDPINNPLTASIEMSALLTPVTAGTIQRVTVTAKDQSGNVSTSYTGTIHFSTNDNYSSTVLPADYTFQPEDKGVKEFYNIAAGDFIKLTRAATDTYVKVEDTSNPDLYYKQDNITVNHDAENKITFTSDEQTNVPAGTSSAPITIELQDNYGNSINAGSNGKAIYMFTDSGWTIVSMQSFSGGTTYYISTSGDNGNDGLSAEAPFKTFSGAGLNADNALSPGDKVLFKRGDEWIGEDADVEVNSSGTADNFIVIGAYGDGDAPLFTGAIRTDSMPEWINWTVYSGNIWVSNTNPADYLDWWIYTIGVGESRNLFNATQLGEMYAGSYYHDHDNRRLYVWLEDGSDPNNSVIRIGKNTTGGHVARGLVRTAYWGGKAAYVKFENLHVRFANRMGFTSCDPYVEFHDCVSECNGRAGFDIIQAWCDPPGGQHNRLYSCTARWNNASLGQAFNTDALDTQFIDCLSEYNYMAGFDFLDYNDNTNATGKMLRCIARYNGRNKRSNSWDPNIYVDGGHDIQIIDCQAYGAGDWDGANYQNGITIGTEHSDKPVYNIDIINCLSYNNKGAALSVDALSGVTAEISNVRVLGCTFARGPTGYRTLIITDLASPGVELKNNIYFGNTGSTIASFSDDTIALMDSDYNIWWTTSSKQIEADGVEMSLSDFQSRYGLDLNSIVQDPLFVDSSAGSMNARLKRTLLGDPSDSPAIDMAEESVYPVSEYSDIGTTRNDDVSDETYNMDLGYHYNAVYGSNGSTPQSGFSLDGNAPWDETSVTIPEGSSSAVFYYMDTVAGTYTFTIADEPVPDNNSGLPNDTQSINIVE